MKKCCKKIPIEFHISDYKLIFVFIFPICEVLNTEIRKIYLKTYYEFFLIFSTYLSYLFSFIFLIIINIRTRKQKTGIKINEANESMNTRGSESQGIINVEIKKEANKQSIKNLIYIIVLSGINMCFSHFNYESFHDKRTIGLSYKIAIFFLLSFIILKYKHSKLHYITFGINIITLIIKYAITIAITNSGEYVGKHIWFYLIYALSFCLFLTLGKYYMDNCFQTPYFILFFIGVIICIILLIIAFIKFLAGYESDIFLGFQNNVNGVANVFWFIGDILTQFGMYLGLWITVYYFTPVHTIISENIVEIIYYIVDFKDNEFLWEGKNVDLNIYLYPFIHIINLICSLIFNEIIILKFCGLDYFTKVKIRERELEEANKLEKMLIRNENGSRNSSESGSFSLND